MHSWVISPCTCPPCLGTQRHWCLVCVCVFPNQAPRLASPFLPLSVPLPIHAACPLCPGTQTQWSWCVCHSVFPNKKPSPSQTIHTQPGHLSPCPYILPASVPFAPGLRHSGDSLCVCLSSQTNHSARPYLFALYPNHCPSLPSSSTSVSCPGSRIALFWGRRAALPGRRSVHRQ
mgnify:CR=1 FL=1